MSLRCRCSTPSAPITSSVLYSEPGRSSSRSLTPMARWTPRSAQAFARRSTSGPSTSTLDAHIRSHNSSQPSAHDAACAAHAPLGYSETKHSGNTTKRRTAIGGLTEQFDRLVDRGLDVEDHRRRLHRGNPHRLERHHGHRVIMRSSTRIAQPLHKILERFECDRCQFIDVGSESMSMSGPIDPLLRAEPTMRRNVDVEALYLEHRARLLGVAAAITLDRAVAEEVVQDAFAGLQRHAERVDNPVGYLQRSVVNISINLIRRRRVAEAHPAIPSLPRAQPRSTRHGLRSSAFLQTSGP